MPRFDFQSPGAAASDEITKFLAERAIEKRQAMLDRLNEEEMRSQMTAREAQTDIARQNQALQEKQEGRLQAGQTHSQGIADLGLIPGGAPESSIDPEKVAFAQKYGLFIPGATATPRPAAQGAVDYAPSAGEEVPVGSEGAVPKFSSSVEDTLPQESVAPPRVYAGNEDFQKEQRDNAALDKYLADNPQLATENPELLRALTSKRAGFIDNVPGALFEPPPSVTRVGPKGNVMPAIEGRRGTTFMELGYPPQPTAAAQPSLYQFPDSKDPTKTVSHWLRPGQQPSTATVIEGGVARKGNVPTTADQPMVPNALWTARINASKAPETTQRARDAKAAAVAAADAAIMASARTTPDVIDAVAGAIDYVSDEQAAGREAPPIDVLLSSLTNEKGEPIKPESREYQDAHRLIIGFLYGQGQ